MALWVVACSGESDSKESIMSVLKSRVHNKGLTDELCEFKVPETLKFGSFDNLIKLLDDLQKYDSQVETVLRRIERQIHDLDPSAEFKVISQRAQMSHEQYMRKFQWDDAKFPRTRSIIDNLQLLLASVQKLDEEVRNKATQFGELRTQMTNISKKDGANLLNRDLIDVLTPETVMPDDFVETAHITTLCVTVARGAEKDWLSSYEKLEENVVPMSTKKFKVDDKEGNTLWRVLLFKNSLEGFKAAARQKKFVVRDFTYSAAKYNEVLAQRGAVEADAKKHETFLRRVCHAAFSDTLVAWVHLKAMRVFVESVLRFGVPPNFASFLLKPASGAAKQKKLRDELNDVFSSSGLFGHSYIGQAKDSGEGGGADMEGGEYFPYVSMSFTPVQGRQ